MDKLVIGVCFLFTSFVGTTSMYFKKDNFNSLIAIEILELQQHRSARQIELNTTKTMP